jgi:hypothetical protein
LENLNGRDHVEDLGVDGMLGKYGEKVWNGFIWLRKGASDGVL